MSTESLAKAFASTRTVLAKIQRSQLDAPTPCRSWTVRELINHTIGAPRYGIRVLQTGEQRSEDEDFAAGDFLATYDTTAGDTLAAFGSEDALEKTVALPFAEVPGAFLMMMMTIDQFTHGWDLARATGQETDLDPELAIGLLAQAEIPEQFRGEDGVAAFGPVQEAPAGATEADKLSAYLGRHV